MQSCNGTSGENRTPDPQIKSLLLYRLSYGRVSVFALFIGDKTETLDTQQAVSKLFLAGDTEFDFGSPLLTKGAASRRVAGFLRRLVSQTQLPEFRISRPSIPDLADGEGFSILAGDTGLEPVTH